MDRQKLMSKAGWKGVLKDTHDFASTPIPENETVRGPSIGSRVDLQSYFKIDGRSPFVEWVSAPALRCRARGGHVLVLPWGCLGLRADHVDGLIRRRSRAYGEGGGKWEFLARTVCVCDGRFSVASP